MFKHRVIVIIAVLALAATSCSEPAPTGTVINFSFTGPAVSPNTVYCVWIEDEGGKNLQNLYVCNRVVDIGGSLLGDDLPNWKTKKYPENKKIDGVTGASTQESKTVSRSLSVGSAKRFRVCFEIDRSRNGNAYFYGSAFLHLRDGDHRLGQPQARVRPFADRLDGERYRPRDLWPTAQTGHPRLPAVPPHDGYLLH